MGFLDSIKNFFTGSKASSAPAQTSTSSPVTFGIPQSDPVAPISFNTQSSTPAVGNLPPAPNMSTPNGAVYVPPPKNFTLSEQKSTPADSLDQPRTNLSEVQASISSSTSSPTGAGFKASESKGTDDQPEDKSTPATTREMIQQGLLDVLNKDTSAEKAKLREEAGIEEKSKTSNRILNQLRTMRVDYEAKKDKLENENNRGRSMGAINNEINQLTKNTNRNLAYKSIEYDIANNDLRSAEATVNDRIQDMKDEEAKQISLYKTLYDFVQDDMSESEKLEAQQAFASKEAERGFERSKELAQYNSLLRREESQLSFALQSAVTAQEASDASKAMIPSLKDKAGQLTEAMNNLKNGDVGNVVGANPFARFSLTRIFSGKDDAFIGSVDQLTSRETLDTLIALKAKGGTLGALSEKELAMLDASASKIGTWRMTNDDGKTTGYKIDKANFNKELQTLKTLTNKAIVEAGGDLNADPLGLGIGQNDPLSLGI